MPALESHTGLLKQTIPFYNRRRFVNISNTKQHYCAFPAIQRNARRAVENKWTRFQFGLPVEVFNGGGYQFEYNLQVASHNSMEWVSEDDPVNIDKRDFQVRANLPWRLARMQKWSYGKWELSACKGQEELTNLITSRALGNEQGAVDGFENWFWSAPVTSSDDKTAFPLRYWLYTEPETAGGAYTALYNQIVTTTTNGNLMNINHANYLSGPGGVSRATYRLAGNWNCQYTTFSDTDAVEKITHAALDTDFHSPVEFPNLVKEAPEKAMYTTKANLIVRARLARQQNDANGSDLNTRFTETDTFRIPMYRVPQLDSTDFTLYGASNKDVIYGIDWSTWYWASKSGFTMQDEIFEPSLEAPMTYTHVRFLGGQLVCLEPRRNFVLSK